MADEHDVLLREIDEDLKQERLFKLWKDYGNYAIAGVVAIVIGVAAFKGWQNYSLALRMEQGESFAAAQEEATKKHSDDALIALQNLTQEAGRGYAMLARFRTAALMGEKGNSSEAANIYATLADNGSIDKVYRELAVVLGALQELNNTERSNKLIERAKNMAKAEGVWRHNAREIEALAALANGKNTAANAIFKELSNTAGIPQGIRARAREMLSITQQIKGPA